MLIHIRSKVFFCIANVISGPVTWQVYDQVEFCFKAAEYLQSKVRFIIPWKSRWLFYINLQNQ